MSRDLFLDRVGWGGATIGPLAPDASARHYLRLTRGSESAVLMVAPVATEADRAGFTAFRRIGAHLRRLGLSAPEEYAADPTAGFVLMEDLGDRTLSHLLKSDPDTAREAYAATIALLPRLHVDPPADLARPDARDLAGMVGLTFDLLPKSDALRAALLPALEAALTPLTQTAPVLSLRDVHGNNLLWLPDREVDARIGLLDYQDAMLLPDGYDLASLLDDPRRVVPEDWREAFLRQADANVAHVTLLSLTRNLRILGIFHRLSAQFGKPHYATFIPRTRAVIARAAAELPSLRAPVAELLDRTEDWGAP